MRWRLQRMIKGKYGYITGVKYGRTAKLKWNYYEIY